MFIFELSEGEGYEVQHTNKGNPITCDCGKIVAFERNGKIYVQCYRCKREIEVTRVESRDHSESRDH
jgi:hypothetical protein